MAFRRSALIGGAAFLLLGLLNFISGPLTQHPQAIERRQGSLGAAPGAASASPRPAASPPTTSPTTRPAERLKATIVSVQGLAQVRHRADGPWQRCEVGMVLEEDAVFRTGSRSVVRFAVGPDETVTVDRLGVRTVRRAVEESRRPTLNDDAIHLDRGRIRYDFHTAGHCF